MGEIVFEGFMKDNDPRWNTTSVSVGRSLSLSSPSERAKAAKNRADKAASEQECASDEADTANAISSDDGTDTDALPATE